MRIKAALNRIILAVLSAALVLVAECTPVYAATVSDLENEKKEIEEQKKKEEEKKKEQQKNLDSANSRAGAIAGELSDVGEEIEELDSTIVETIASIDMIEEEISDKEAEIAVTTEEYEEARATEQAQYEAMKLRIRYMYEKGDYSYMQILLESQSFSDFVNKADYIEKLYDYDRKLLKEYQQAKENTLALKEQLEEEKDELDTTLHELNEEKESLDKMLAEKEAEYDNYSAQLARARKEAAAYKANVEAQNAAIRALEKKSADKQNEIDAAIKAEEERKKAEEEERKRAESSSAAESSSDSADSGGSSSSNQSSESKSYSSANSFSGSKGQQIASYALQFVGNPYVPGGTSLTQGADCSGFIWRIYKDFGYSLPRTSTAMRNAGTEVSYANAQPGDIFCYAGHVGLYIGNGTIVHASTQRTGIKTTNALYKSIITIRRIV